MVIFISQYPRDRPIECWIDNSGMRNHVQLVLHWQDQHEEIDGIVMVVKET